MTTKLFDRAARLARNVLSFAAPALVVGLVLVSQAQGRINYPPAPAGTLEHAVDTILLKERADIIRQSTLIQAQNRANARLGGLEQQLSQATDPAVIAALQRQIAQTQAQLRQLQTAITRNTQVLRNDLNVLNPQKDRALQALNRLTQPKNQIQQFTQAALRHQATYAALIRRFLGRRPISPVVAF